MNYRLNESNTHQGESDGDWVKYYSLYAKEYENAARINTAHAFLV